MQYRKGQNFLSGTLQIIETKVIKENSIIHKCIETLFIEIKKQNKKILIACAYKPNKSDDQFFINKLSNLISNNLKKKYDEIILTGDFNFDLLKYDENSSTLNFLNSLTSLSLIPVISKPTRITDNSATLIDNIFILNPINFISGIIISDISDHLPTFISIKNVFSNVNSDLKTKIQYRLINENSMNDFFLNMSACDFSNINNSNDCSSAIVELQDIIDETFRSSCPLITKTISFKNAIKPWITDKILTHIKKRQHYFILYRKNVITKKTYSNYRNFVTSLIRKAKKQYYEDKFYSARNDIKKTWRIINDVLRPNKIHKKQNIIKKLIINNTTYENSQDISNIFNDHFVSIGRNMAESVVSGPNDHKKYLSHLNVPNSFFFTPVTPNETHVIINSLKNKSSNLNTVSTRALKFVSKIISIPLTNIINNSFTSGIFPDSLKVARVTPIYKEDKKTDFNNYRPISVLPIMSKVFEKLAYKQLYNFLNINALLENKQYGFRAHRSTTQAILNFMDYLYNNLDKNKLVFSIFLDFQKAFDSVDHTILLSKLNFYGIRGHAHDWFRSYLANRKQFVTIDNSSSKLRQIEYGVPQGSIMGPLLFLIFINDISKCSPLFHYILYADDSTLSTWINEDELKENIELINTELDHLYFWLNANKITINKTKTKYMMFSYRRNIMITDIKIGNNIIDEADFVKFLGIYIDNHLSFRNHINEISIKISKSVGLLHKLNKFLPPKILKIVYTSFIHPYLSYGIEAWHGTFKNWTQKIFILQKKAIRALNKLEYNHHTNEYYKLNNIIKLEDQYKIQISNYIFRHLNSNIDPETSAKFEKNLIIHPHDTRHGEQMRVTRVNRSISKNMISHNGTKVWNSLPHSVKSSNSYYKFKKQVKEFFLNKY